MTDFEKLTLNIFKSKTVKTPAKSWAAAGWDFYIPENLSLFDFTKSYKNYLDESIEVSKEVPYVIPLVFHLKSERTRGEYDCQLVLSWNSTLSQWMFNIREYNKDRGIIGCLTSIDEPSDKIVQWLTEDGTVISSISILPQARILIPSGIHVDLPNNVYLIADNKSGIASKRGLIVGSDIIDTDYMGEIHIHLINTGEFPVLISAGEKIVQLLPTFQPNMNEVKEFSSKDELYKNKISERGEGGFGSSGLK